MSFTVTLLASATRMLSRCGSTNLPSCSTDGPSDAGCWQAGCCRYASRARNWWHRLHAARVLQHIYLTPYPIPCVTTFCSPMFRRNLPTASIGVTPVKLVHEEGKVSGAIFNTSEGYVQVNAKNTLLRGGYPANPDYDEGSAACRRRLLHCFELQPRRYRRWLEGWPVGWRRQGSRSRADDFRPRRCRGRRRLRLYWQGRRSCVPGNDLPGEHW